jgi:voltage-gated potassium channel
MFGRNRSEADLLAEGPRVAEWERRAEWPLTFLAALFLAGYAIEVLKHPLPPGWHRDIEAATWAIWAVFAVDFIARVSLARRHIRYIWRHIADVLIIALPMLRPLRLLRVVLLVRTLNRRAASSFGGSVVVYGGTVGLLIIFCASLAVLQAERGHGGSIQHFGDALWWSVVTISTVGYGDKYPVTGEGKFVAAALMLTGVALFGAVTASFASWLVDQARDEEAADQQATRDDLDALREQFDRMETQLARISAAIGVEQPDAGNGAHTSTSATSDGSAPPRTARTGSA